MTTWTLLLMSTPLNTAASPATGLLGELSKARGVGLSFNLYDPATLTFTLPGRDAMTAKVEPLLTDVLAYRDDYCVQRFRVVSSRYDKSGGVLTASFTAVSYQSLLDAWVFHGSDTRSWTSTEQSALAWAIINGGQAKTRGTLGITKGLAPTVTVLRTRDGGTEQPEGYEAGKRRGEAVKQLSEVDNGFEWDIEPDRTSRLAEQRGLKFNAWNEGARGNHAPRSAMLLDDGGTVVGWSRSSSPQDYANVVRVSGATESTENGGTAPVAWRPATRNPSGTPPEGRWERQIGSDLSESSELGKQADRELAIGMDYLPTWSLDVLGSRWGGPSEMWLGDTCRMIVRDGPLDVDQDVRVMTIGISIEDSGIESLSLSVDREAADFKRDRNALMRRIENLERF